MHSTWLLSLWVLPFVAVVSSFNANRPHVIVPSRGSRSDGRVLLHAQADDGGHFMDYLKFDGIPTFDVLQKTKDYVMRGIESNGQYPPGTYADDYVLRGPVIGPMTNVDLQVTQGGFKATDAFPDLKTNPFGFVVDPENPYRCLWFEKWTGTHTGTLFPESLKLEATGNKMETPLMSFYVVWNPEGQLVYSSVGNVVDRHEGNTMGKGAVFGLFHTAGLKLAAAPGSRQLRFQQRLGHFINGLTGKGGRSYSREEDIPSWYKSRSRGADPNDPNA